MENLRRALEKVGRLDLWDRVERALSLENLRLTLVANGRLDLWDGVERVLLRWCQNPRGTTDAFEQFRREVLGEELLGEHEEPT
jgi:hypothetical protein